MPTSDQLILNTERLQLRPLRESDAESLLAIFSDTRVMRYWGFPPWTSIEQAHESISSGNKAMSGGEHFRFGLERTIDQQLIGVCTLLNLVDQCRRAEVGYVLSSSAWGHGFIHEALTSLLNFGFSELKLNRIEADIDPRNEASAKVLHRLGFQQEGLLRERWIVAGEVSDTAFFGLLFRDWSARG